MLTEDRRPGLCRVTETTLALLEPNAKIKARFLAEPDWLNLYGLPIHYENRAVDGNPNGLQVLRTQRTVFEIWNVPAPGTTPGRVQFQNVPDKVKKLNNVIIPDAVKNPLEAFVPPPDSASDAQTDPAATLSTHAAGEIARIAWVQDGVTPIERQALDELTLLGRVSEGFLLHIFQHVWVSGIHSPPNERDLPIPSPTSSCKIGPLAVGIQAIPDDVHESIKKHL